MTNNQVAIHEDPITKGIIDLENTNKLCALLLKTPHYAKMGQDGIYAVVAKAKSLNVDTFDALNGALYYVNGKVGMSTEMMACLVRQAGHSVVKDPKSTPNNCILHGKRKDNGDTWTVSFSIEDAKKAGIFKEASPWGKYPATMCYNRAMSTLFRQLFPDLSKGAGYTMDELNEISSHKEPKFVESLQEATFEEVKEERITAEQSDQLKDLWSKCDEKYVEKAKKSITGLGFIPEEMPVDLYEKVKMAAIKNAKPLAVDQKLTQAEMQDFIKSSEKELVGSMNAAR